MYVFDWVQHVMSSSTAGSVQNSDNVTVIRWCSQGSSGVGGAGLCTWDLWFPNQIQRMKNVSPCKHERNSTKCYKLALLIYKVQRTSWLLVFHTAVIQTSDHWDDHRLHVRKLRSVILFSTRIQYTDWDRQASIPRSSANHLYCGTLPESLQSFCQLNNNCKRLFYLCTQRLHVVSVSEFIAVY